MTATPSSSKPAKTEAAADAGDTGKRTKADGLFVAYRLDLNEPDTIADLRIYGRKEPAQDFALDQDPAWKVLPVAKGESIAEAIKTARAGR